MKIAMIGAKRIPSREGGIDVVVGKIATELVKAGNEVTVYVRKKKGIKPQKTYNGAKLKEVFTINKKSTDALIYSFFATLKGLLGKYDVLHFHASGNTFFLWLTKFSKKKIISTCHGIDWKRSKFTGIGARILLKAEKRMVKYSDQIITLSQNDHDYFKETYGKETCLIPNGFERFQLTEPQIITEKYGLHKEDYILFLARIVPEKGLHYLIEAYKQLDLPFKLVVAGGGSHSTQYYNEMEVLAHDNLNIIFTGFVQGQELEELYSNAYLYVLPSDIEGMPMSLLEALGHRRVCLVSDIPENHVDETNSYFFEKANVSSLKRMLLELSATRKDFYETDALIGWNEVAKKTISVYENENVIEHDKNSSHKECMLS